MSTDYVDDAASFARLLTGAFTVPLDPAGRRALDNHEVAERLCMPVSTEFELGDWLMMRLGADEILTSYQYGMVDSVENILRYFSQSTTFHPQFADLLNRYRGFFAASALPDDNWIANPQHPARKLFACLYALSCGWHPELGTAAVAMKTEAERWLSALTPEPASWQATAQTAAIWLEDERRRVERLEKRIADAESAQMRERRARQIATRTLNQTFQDREITSEVAEMLVQDWLPAMHWTLVRHGEQSPIWQRLKRMTNSLRWTLVPDPDDEGKQKSYRLVSQFSGEFAQIGPQIFLDENLRNRVTELLEYEHLRALRDMQRETSPFVPVNTADAFADASTSLSANILDLARSLTNGQWFLLKDQDKPRRARLLLRQDDTQQLLFVSAAGIKALVASFEQFAMMLTNGTAEVLPDKVPLHAAIAAVIEDLRIRHQRAQQSRIEQLRIAREHAAADARAKEAARQKALAEAHAVEEARREANRRKEQAEHEAEQARLAAEATQKVAEQKERDAAQQRQQRARLLISSLTIGNWVVFKDVGGHEDRRRLTVVLPSSGKHIFVDVTGTGKREISREDLIRGFADGTIALLNKDSKIDDALTRVVDNLRQDRSPGTPR